MLEVGAGLAEVKRLLIFKSPFEPTVKEWARPQPRTAYLLRF
jgi:hypothetical protein